MHRFKTLISMLFASAAFALLILFPAQASNGAVRGLDVCARVIIPSLFPFFVLSRLLTGMGLPAKLSVLLASPGRRLFGISGAGVSAFIFSLCGGYPLGASVTAEMASSGTLSKKEAERMLSFCNNCGPAFIIGAVGGGLFQNAGLGLLLWGIHILTSVLIGVLSSVGKKPPHSDVRDSQIQPLPFSRAFSEGVKSGVSTTLTVCGFVVFFSVITGLLEQLEVFPAAAGRLAAAFPIGLQAAQSLLWGLLELGGGIAAMAGMSATPQSLALAAFITGWGGLSVHFQTAAVLGDTGISTKKHTAGRFLHGIISAGMAYLTGLLI